MAQMWSIGFALSPALSCLVIVAGIKYWPQRQRVVCPDCADELRR